jgi:hypothetical protein
VGIAEATVATAAALAPARVASADKSSMRERDRQLHYSNRSLSSVCVRVSVSTEQLCEQ